MDSLCRANLHFSQELQGFRGGHGFCETVRSESNRPRVLREQKVLPEARNLPLLLKDFFLFFNLRNRPRLLRESFSSSTFKKLP